MWQSLDGVGARGACPTSSPPHRTCSRSAPTEGSPHRRTAASAPRRSPRTTKLRDSCKFESRNASCDLTPSWPRLMPASTSIAGSLAAATAPPEPELHADAEAERPEAPRDAPLGCAGRGGGGPESPSGTSGAADATALCSPPCARLSPTPTPIETMCEPAAVVACRGSGISGGASVPTPASATCVHASACCGCRMPVLRMGRGGGGDAATMVTGTSA
eukprot:143432-Chlamydomonas_euryale.AAC.1